MNDDLGSRRTDDPAPLTVATVQASSVAGDVSANAAAAADAVREAAGRGARLAVFPELFLGGYDLATIGDRPDDCLLDDAGDPRLAPLVEACASTGTTALVGAGMRRAGGSATISTLAVTDRVTVAYDKQHVCDDEADHFVPGDDGAIVTVDGWPLGLAVCYDGCFPEHARAAADAGALGYLVSMAYVVGSEHRRDLYYRARAVENGMFVVTSGLVGRCGSGDFSGGSAILDAEGRPLESVHDGVEQIAVATLDVRDLERTRSAHRMHADHRDSLGSVQPVRL